MPVSRALLPLTLAAVALLGACSSVSPFANPFAGPASSPRKETVFAVTDAAELIKFNAGQPSRVLARQSLKGLPAGERLLGIDYRVARGVLVALSSGGRLFTVGALGTGTVEEAAFDIADIDNSALAALHQGGTTRLHWLDLATGRAELLGTVGDGRALWGMAIEP